MRRAWTWIDDNGLLLVFCGLFLGFLVGQALCGEVAYNSTRARAGLPAVGHWKYLLTGNFLEGVFENWQAAILQLGSLILFGIFLRQRGAPHSRKNVHRRRGTLKNWLYGNSLTIAFAVLFLAAFAMHLYAGTLQANEQRAMLHQPRVSMGQFLGSAQVLVYDVSDVGGGVHGDRAVLLLVNLFEAGRVAGVEADMGGEFGYRGCESLNGRHAECSSTTMREEGTMAPRRETKKRLGKKHRQASTRPKMGRTAPRGTATTGAVSPKKRKELAAKKAAAVKVAKTPTKSPDREHKVVLRNRDEAGTRGYGGDFDDEREARDTRTLGKRNKSSVAGGAGSAHEERDWKEAEKIASALTLATDVRAPSRATRLPLVAICGRPNVGKSTLFNRLTQTRRSIVGDEPGITRDRIYGEVEWAGRDVRLVDTGGVVPDDEALIPSEIFRQAKVGLEEADAIIMVVDGRTELAAPDVELARLLLRGGKPIFLAVNKMDSAEMYAAAENFRRLGFKNVCPISAEHGVGHWRFAG